MTFQGRPTEVSRACCAISSCQIHKDLIEWEIRGVGGEGCKGNSSADSESFCGRILLWGLVTALHRHFASGLDFALQARALV